MPVPTAPSVAGYEAFLYGSVGIVPAALPRLFVGAATFVAASDVMTVVSSQAGQLAEDTVVVDGDGGALLWSPDAEISIVTQLTGSPSVVGTYQLSAPAAATIATAELVWAPNPAVLASLTMALETVLEALAMASGRTYTLAVFNLAADRLLNYAEDVTGQTYFKDARRKMRLDEPAVGLTTAASDQGTTGSLMNPDYLRLLTLEDLQSLKTPWGRRYLGIAQAYGATAPWGLT